MYVSYITYIYRFVAFRREKKILKYRSNLISNTIYTRGIFFGFLLPARARVYTIGVDYYNLVMSHRRPRLFNLLCFILIDATPKVCLIFHYIVQRCTSLSTLSIRACTLISGARRIRPIGFRIFLYVLSRTS